jgi:hypothetical protein
MTLFRAPLVPALHAALLACVLALGPTLAAAEGGFTTLLPADVQAAAGLTRLTTAERTALDQFVAAELAWVRAGGGRELAGTFVSRRTPPERQQAGLDRLSPAELARLDELVAAAQTARPAPKERPRLHDDDVINVRKAELHGSASLTYGWGGGGHFQAASFNVNYFDPATGLGLSVGVGTVSGHGFRGYHPFAFAPDYYDLGPAYYYDPFYSGAAGGDFTYGSGQSFRPATDGDAFGRGYLRRR